MPFRWMRRGGTVAAAALCASAAWAGPLVITPTTVTIPPDRHSAVVEVENASDEPVDLQFRAYDWSQPDGQDRLTPTDRLVVSPPIASVAPHAKQVFRVLQIGPAPAAGEGERSWRLRLNQLPRADQPAVAIAVEFLLPVFQGQPDAAPRLSWTLGQGEVIVANRGNRRARIGHLTLQSPAGAAEPVPGAASTYILSGAQRTFKLNPGAPPPAAARLAGATDTGPIDAVPAMLAAR